MAGSVSIGRDWGQVTSTYRTPAHNRAVGGVPNSHHLRGRAIDIARRPGVTHAQLEAAYRRAGYRLIESIDEGDHSHFAFAGPGGVSRSAARGPEGTRWGIVYAAAAGEDDVRPARLEVVTSPGALTPDSRGVSLVAAGTAVTGTSR